ncbi:hypothetical protein OC834_007987, partial [Tilletia horrida]
AGRIASLEQHTADVECSNPGLPACMKIVLSNAPRSAEQIPSHRYHQTSAKSAERQSIGHAAMESIRASEEGRIDWQSTLSDRRARVGLLGILIMS